MELTTVEDYIKEKLTHSIHTSEVRSFWGCRRRHDLIFTHFYYPQVTAKPLEFGVAYHKAMETMYDPDMWQDRESSAAASLVVFKDTVEAQREKYRSQQGELSEEDETDYNERVELGLGMLKYYGKKFLPYEELTPVKVEIKFEVPIVHSDGRTLWCKCNNCWKRYKSWLATKYPDYPENNVYTRETWKGLPVTYGGRLDVLFQDENGEYWIGDWKTARALTADGSDDYLELDLQITSYCWALMTLGIPIAGFLYMEIKKGFPQEPEPLKRSYRGCLYSKSKSNDYDYESYVNTVEENDPVAFAAGFYDDYLEWLRDVGVQFHKRHQIHRSVDELHIAGDYLFNVAADITDPNLRVYPTPGRFSCGFCAFIDVCKGMNRGEDVQYLLDTAFDKRRYHYWEDAPASTESKGGQ
jgi:hypothetical protein